VKVPFPRRFNAWLVAAVSLIAVAVVGVAPMIRTRAQSSTYTFTDLGTLGGTQSKAFGINNCGMIVGDSAPSGISPIHPFLWRDLNGNLVSDPGEMKDLGTLGGLRGSATDINASGLVVGHSTIAAAGDQHAFRWFDSDGDGISDPGEMNDLGVLPNHSTHGALGVNDNGQIVGSAENEGGSASAFLWNANTGLQLLATLNGIAPSFAYSINNSSHIAGWASNTDHAFLFNGTTNIDLGTFGGNRSIAYDINAAGHAVGFAHVDASSAGPPSRAFKWNGTALQDLGVLAGGVRSQAYSVNSSGITVGYSEVTGGAPHAFVHNGTQMLDLNTLTSLPAGWTSLVEARGINDGGQIVGYGKFNGEDRAFLLTPASFTPSCSPSVTVTVSPASVSEDGATNLTYTFTRAPVTNSPLTVNFVTTGSTADSSDYGISSSGSVTILANQPSTTVVVDPTQDSTVEPNESVILTIAASPGYVIGSPGAATGTIANNDTDVTISLSPLTVTESGAPNLVYTFARTGVTTGALTVNYSVSGTATRGDDYSAPFTSSTGSVTIADGSSTATVTVDPTPDSLLEGDETVTLTVTGGTGYNVGSPISTQGTITPDAPVVYVKDGTENNPIPNAIAIDSVTFVRGPFRLTNEWNLTPSDRATRVILVTSPLGMTQADLATGILSVHIAGYANNPLPIENVGPITGVVGLNASFIIVRLPAELSTLNLSPGPNNLTLTVKMGSATSNATILSITP
jgi:probable HAF family extracellular repeat protein